mmetsp:Transcript_89799/g.187681  ORF Transcript_89799/g.187681 Transcript_89799/m.187681 type:complete len:214 (-) Transcript_89799:890-1531(-)
MLTRNLGQLLGQLAQTSLGSGLAVLVLLCDSSELLLGHGPPTAAAAAAATIEQRSALAVFTILSSVPAQVHCDGVQFVLDVGLLLLQLGNLLVEVDQNAERLLILEQGQQLRCEPRDPSHELVSQLGEALFRMHQSLLAAANLPTCFKNGTFAVLLVPVELLVLGHARHHLVLLVCEQARGDALHSLQGVLGRLGNLGPFLIHLASNVSDDFG